MCVVAKSFAAEQLSQWQQQAQQMKYEFNNLFCLFKHDFGEIVANTLCLFCCIAANTSRANAAVSRKQRCVMYAERTSPLHQFHTGFICSSGSKPMFC